MGDQQPARISTFWLETPEQRRLRLARRHRLNENARKLAAATRKAARKRYTDQGDIERPLWFVDETNDRHG